MGPPSSAQALFLIATKGTWTDHCKLYTCAGSPSLTFVNVRFFRTISPCLLAFKSPTSRLFILTNNPSQVFWTSRRCLSLLALYGIRRKSCTYCLRDCLTFLSIELVDPGSSLRVVDYEGQRAGQFGPGKSTYLSEVFSMLLWAGMSSSQIGMWILDNVLSAGPGPSAL